MVDHPLHVSYPLKITPVSNWATFKGWASRAGSRVHAPRHATARVKWPLFR
jgi:hypothetical protein